MPQIDPETGERIDAAEIDPATGERVKQRKSPAPKSEYKSVLSKEGQHPILSKALGYIPAVTATAAGLAASESGPGAVAAAAGGGYLGKRIEQGARNKLGFDTPEEGTRAEAAVEGAKQGAYELGGRAVGAVGGKLIGKLRGIEPEVVGKTIAGVKLPETVGQASGKRLPQTLEHYLYASWLGKPLQAVKEGQQAASREILANLSKATEATPGKLAGNWERATQETKILGDKMYEAIDQIEAPTVGPAAKQILEDESLRLPAKARTAVAKATGVGGSDAERYAKDLAKALGFKDFHDPKLIAQLPKEVQAELRASSKVTIRDAINARSELRDLAVNSEDRNLQRLYHDAYEKMDSAINASLTPEQRAIKAEADKVWRRSYIQEEVADELRKMQSVAAPGSQAPVAVDSFVRMVNDLAHQPLYREAGKVVARPSKLDVLFDNPADRQAMKDLATFMKEKYTTMGGQQGISESIARIGVALEAARIPIAAATGRETVAAHATLTLMGLAGMAHMLANPGGAKLLATYFRSGGAEAVALAARIASEAVEQKLEGPAPRGSETPVPVSTAAPAPRLNPTDEWQQG